jgi:N-acetylglucosamine-6-phosphate deacetylase
MYTIIGDIVTPEGVLENWALTVDDGGRIAEVGPKQEAGTQSGDIDARGLLVLPGFIDMHVHGGGGADFMHGTVEAVQQVARTHARFGTTGLLATTITAGRENTDKAISAAREVSEAGPGVGEARVLGIHLEGPYLCAAKRGAQPLAFVRPPDAEELTHWIALSGGTVRQITLAPEIVGAEEIVRLARAQGVIVSVGHTDATAEETLRTIGWGATQATHTFNAMRGLHHREPGTVGAVLTQPEVVCEIIADGVHLDPLIVKLIVAAKGVNGAVLITDAIEGAAMPDGDYELGGQKVIVQRGMAAFADGTLAGSVLTMNRAFRNVVRFAGVSLADAARLSSGNAARQLGIAREYGEIAPGKAADLVIMHPETGGVEQTLVGGRTAYRR